ncbi:hypothetical protein T11_13096 [Trichinella zimbabwensis]|uniref:Uncharacterized protein n=1 Tax=Trichinella zimbabwensis TaxID=268475 RepID=A0A0V1HV70_9BILA|nr:hypothetical protein T11_13096 [Trichinella zimbabwensis]
MKTRFSMLKQRMTKQRASAWGFGRMFVFLCQWGYQSSALLTVENTPYLSIHNSALPNYKFS